MPKPKRARETSNPLGQKLNTILAEKGMEGDYAAVAKHFGVAVPSVYGWIDNGRISKSRLTQLAEWSGRPITWWLDEREPERLTDIFEDWRLHASPRSVAVITQLTIAARRNALTEEDWQLIEQLAQRFLKKR
jgi:transposase